MITIRLDVHGMKHWTVPVFGQCNYGIMTRHVSFE